MIELVKVLIFEIEVVGFDGLFLMKKVMCIGNFNLVIDEGYLIYFLEIKVI